MWFVVLHRYVSEPDHTLHEQGFHNGKINEALHQLDLLFRYIVAKLENNAELYEKLNIILTADHGHAQVTFLIKVVSENLNYQVLIWLLFLLISSTFIVCLVILKESYEIVSISLQIIFSQSNIKWRFDFSVTCSNFSGRKSSKCVLLIQVLELVGRQVGWSYANYWRSTTKRSNLWRSETSPSARSLQHQRIPKRSKLCLTLLRNRQ